MKLIRISNIFFILSNLYVIMLKLCMSIKKKDLFLTFEYFYYFLIVLFIVYFPLT